MIKPFTLMSYYTMGDQHQYLSGLKSAIYQEDVMIKLPDEVMNNTRVQKVLGIFAYSNVTISEYLAVLISELSQSSDDELVCVCYALIIYSKMSKLTRRVKCTDMRNILLRGWPSKETVEQWSAEYKLAEEIASN